MRKKNMYIQFYLTFYDDAPIRWIFSGFDLQLPSAVLPMLWTMANFSAVDALILWRQQHLVFSLTLHNSDSTTMSDVCMS